MAAAILAVAPGRSLGQYNCPGTPSGSCNAAVLSQLKIKDYAADGGSAGDKLQWKYKELLPPVLADFGVPTGTTNYALCLYAGTTAALALEVNVPGGANWLPISNGYNYLDPTLAEDGTKKVVLKGTASYTKVLLKGSNANLPLTPATLPLDTSADIVVQLRNDSNSNCWEAAFPPASVIVNTEFWFQAGIP